MAYEQPRSGTVNQASCVLEHHRVKAEVPAADGRETARHSILATTQIILPLSREREDEQKLSEQLHTRGSRPQEGRRVQVTGRRGRAAP